MIQNWVPEDRLIPPAYYPMPITRGRYEWKWKSWTGRNPATPTSNEQGSPGTWVVVAASSPPGRDSPAGLGPVMRGLVDTRHHVAWVETSVDHLVDMPSSVLCGVPKLVLLPMTILCSHRWCPSWSSGAKPRPSTLDQVVATLQARSKSSDTDAIPPVIGILMDASCGSLAAGGRMPASSYTQLHAADVLDFQESSYVALEWIRALRPLRVERRGNLRMVAVTSCAFALEANEDQHLNLASAMVWGMMRTVVNEL